LNTQLTNNRAALAQQLKDGQERIETTIICGKQDQGI